jgi:CHAT domain
LDSLRRPGLTYAEEGAAFSAADATLAWLWDAIVSPVLPSLITACGPASGGRPRIWWCPTGPLTFLLVHAAGRHDGGGDSVLDHFVSSYAPTLRLLLRARDRGRQPADGAVGLAPMIVAMPDTPGQGSLPNADVEVDVFVQRFPAARQFRGGVAVTADVAAALEQSPPVAHFACHGTQDVTDPSSGYLALHDGQLGITTVAGMRLDSAELAFLSACETSRGGFNLSDEAITVATAFQIAGYRHVIGTLWNISDRLAPEVARHVYDQAQRRVGSLRGRPPQWLCPGRGASCVACLNA